MNLPSVLLALTLSFTYPTVSAYARSCTPDSLDYLDDLTWVEVHFTPRYTTQDTVLYRASAVGMAGQHASITVNPQREGTLWVETVDDAGNHSCRSNYVVNAYTTSVPVTDDHVDRVFWYDVLGRRYVAEPKRSGIYLRSQGGKIRKVWKVW